MCGRSLADRENGFGRYGGSIHSLGLEASTMSPKARVLAAISVLVPVALSGVVLAFTPVWWIFTTYGWIVFPAFRLLASGLVNPGEVRPRRIPAETKERELLVALREHGEISSAQAAVETSLSVAEADKMLGELAEGGHLEVCVRGGGIFYALWETGEEA